MVRSIYSGTRNDTSVTLAIQNYRAPHILHFDLLNRSQIIRRVVGHGNCNDTMLQRSVQFILTPEDEHFEGGMHPKAATGSEEIAILKP